MDIMEYLNILMILFILTVIWDVSGIISDLSKFIYENTNKGMKWQGQQLPKLFSCSYCVKFHAIWIYCILVINFPLIYGLFLASVSTFIGILMKIGLTRLTDTLNKKQLYGNDIT